MCGDFVFRTLTTRNRENGEAGAKVVPDLATDTGSPNKDAPVWTYTLKEGLKYEDGTPDSSVINQRLSTSQGADAAAVTTDTNLGPAELAKVAGDKELASRVGTGHFGYTNYIAFNPTIKPFDNVKVRQAIAYAIDRSSVINAAGGSALAEPATTFLPNQKSFGHTPYDHFPAGESGNAAKAGELLKRSPPRSRTR
ncbi:putative ABC transporter solute-binding protein [Streptomyces viridochromogenes Tue57]|uniref:Putative ABC transporter solute-binding protein n=1 Tax=Streptomyces viridochromogenes Tue57 TaxID=1160705 RepID=L8PJ51_STRVR|nr:putative ABC transporter solute-binding protein [Streptomyces viridochromogenes Tue57]